MPFQDPTDGKWPMRKARVLTVGRVSEEVYRLTCVQETGRDRPLACESCNVSSLISDMKLTPVQRWRVLNETLEHVQHHTLPTIRRP